MIKYFVNVKKKFGVLPSIGALLYKKKLVHPQQKLVEMYADVYHNVPCTGLCVNPYMEFESVEIPNVPNPAIEGDAVRVYISFYSLVQQRNYSYTGANGLYLYIPSIVDFTGETVVDWLNDHFKGVFVFESKLGVPTLVSSIFDPEERALDYFVLEFFND
jgi:hypothetical protein